VADPFWEPRIFPAIGGTPEYNSGTATFAGAAAAAIEGFYSRPVSFCFQTFQSGPSGATLANAFGAANPTRCYATPSVGADEAGRSRIFQGIHFQFSNLNGRANGEQIGNYIVTNRLQCLDHECP
jgi:hypothetical protein